MYVNKHMNKIIRFTEFIIYNTLKNAFYNVEPQTKLMYIIFIVCINTSRLAHGLIRLSIQINVCYPQTRWYVRLPVVRVKYETNAGYES